MPFEVNKKFAKITEEHELLLHYIEKDQKDLFKITINPSPPKKSETNYILNNGKEVFIEALKPSKFFSVIKLNYKEEDLGYVLSIKTNEKYNKDTLISVAESIK